MELFLAVTKVKMSAPPPPSAVLLSPLSVSSIYSHTLVTKRKVIKIAFNAPSEGGKERGGISKGVGERGREGR